MEREPDCRSGGIRPLDPMAAVRRDLDPVAGAQHEGVRRALDAERRAPAQEHDPLVPLLIVPAPRRRRLTGGDDPLEREAGVVEQDLDQLAGLRTAEMGEQVASPHAVSRSISALCSG